MNALALAPDVKAVPWDVFQRDVFDWRQGEHVSLIGPTGGGKTTLLLGILPRRQYVTLFAAKPADRTLAGLTREGYQRTATWPPPLPRGVPMHRGRPASWRVLLWPRYRRITDTPAQVDTFRHALHEIFGAGGWTVAVDDASYLCNPPGRTPGLADDLSAFWLNGRSANLTLVASVQRPAWVPLYAYSQATHLFFWRTNDRRDVKTIGGLNGADDKLVQHVVQVLPDHDVLYVNTRTGRMAVTRAERR